MEEQLLKIDEVASLLQVSRSFAYRLMQRGDIPTVRVGKAIRVLPRDLEQYIQKRHTKDESATLSLQRKV